MTTRSCPKCKGQSRDGFLCYSCVRATKKALDRIADLWPALQETITRRDRTQPASEVRAQTIYGPLPFRDAPSRVAAEVRNDLVGWVRISIDELGADVPRDTIPGLCRALSSSAHQLRKHEAAAEWAESIAGDMARIVRAVDLTDRRAPAGPCPERTEDGEPCGGVIVAVYPVDERVSPWMECTKSDPGTDICGGVWDATEWRSLGPRILARKAQIDGQKARPKADLSLIEWPAEVPAEVTPISIADAAVIYGVPPGTIRGWLHDKRLTKYPMAAGLSTPGRPVTVGVDPEQVARLAAERKAELERVRTRGERE